MSSILPTVGRVLYFQPGPADRVVSLGDQPMRADILYVHGPSRLNLHVIDHVGNHYAMADVPLSQDGDERPNCGFAYWMPFQVGQAKAAPVAEAPAPEPAASGAPVASFPNEPVLSQSPEGALVEGAGVVSTEHFNSVAGAESQPT